MHQRQKIRHPESRGPDPAPVRGREHPVPSAPPGYGYHRDEMYYVAIADGFSFSNLDMPPGSPLYLKLFLEPLRAFAEGGPSRVLGVRLDRDPLPA